MRALWIEFVDADTAQRILPLALCGGFNGRKPMPCAQSTKNPCSINLGVGDAEVDIERIHKMPFVVGCGFYEEDRPFLDPIDHVSLLLACAISQVSDVHPTY